MNRVRFLGLALALGVAALSGAQESWKRHMDAGEWLFARGEVSRAEAEFRAALKAASSFPEGDRRLEATLLELARLHEHQQELDEAQPLYDLLVAAVEHRAGPRSPELLDPLAGLARTALGAGDVPTARAALERYAALAATSPDADPDQHWLMLSTLARVEVLAGEDDRALEHQREAVALLEGSTATPAERAMALETLARLEFTAGSPERGMTAILRAADEVAGDPEDGPRPAAILARGALGALNAGERDAAETLALRCLESDPGPEERLDALRAAAGASWLGIRRSAADPTVLWETGLGDPAVETAFQRLTELAGLLDSSGAPLPERIETFRRLAAAAVMAGDATGALEALDVLVSLEREAGNRAGVLRALRDRIGVLQAAGRTGEALEANTLLLDSLFQAHGGDDPSMLPDLERQQELLTAAGRKREARKVRKRIRKLSR